MVTSSDEEAAPSSGYLHLDETPGQPRAHPHPWSFADTDKNPPRPLSRDGSPHVTDEVFNSASHLFATMLSLLGTVLLITQSGGDAWKIVSFVIYGSSLMFLFACSTLHHAISGTEEASSVLSCPAEGCRFPVASLFLAFRGHHPHQF
jgi:hypothetical protein